MAEAHRKRGERDACLRTLAEAVAVVRAIADDSPDAYTCELDFAERYKGSVLSSLAKGHAQAGKFEQALQVANSITRHEHRGDRKPDALMYIASAYLDRGERDAALRILKQAADAGAWRPRLALLYKEAGEHQKALEGAGDHSKTLKELAVLCAKAGRFDDAVATAASIGDPLYQATALARIAAELTASGQALSERARAILAEIARKAKSKAAPKP